jgi:Ni,Fe-hydrogenase III large subunit/Ni,Fe-hydrogenase III component G
MTMRRWIAQLTPLAGTPYAAGLSASVAQWTEIAEDVAASGGQLVALWGTTYAGSFPPPTIRAAYWAAGRLVVAEASLSATDPVYPGLSAVFPAALRMQRAVRDLNGLRALDVDDRPWLRHAAWSEDEYPLRSPPSPDRAAAPSLDTYPFVRVDGEGVHEIAVGPVHAGIIEPGHFRFSAVGEKILRLEERLGYVHKGIESRLAGMPAPLGYRVAGRASGDSTVAYAWAYCQALEGLCSMTVPRRALQLRAVFLELERLQNHLGDLGALGNDAGFAFGLAQFSRLKEELIRQMATTFGSRYLFDAIVPGGVRPEPTTAGLAALAQRIERLAPQCAHLQSIYDEHGGVRDRFAGAGIVTPDLARQLGLAGLAGRASGQSLDLRVDAPWAPYDRVSPKSVIESGGDVAARVAVRFGEIQESCRVILRLVGELAPGPQLEALPSQIPARLAIGLIEGWRGPVMVALETSADGTITRCHLHDPSWQNWPVLEHAVIGNIVPDFPLINKSFNLSYSGHDL